MTGIVKTDQLQGAQSTTITIPTGNKISIVDSATIGTVNATTMKGVTTFTDSAVFSGVVTGAGKILQVVNTSTTTATSTITATGQHDVLTASITPSSTSSKIFITAGASCTVVGGSSSLLASDIYRGTTSDTLVSREYTGNGVETNTHTCYWTASHVVVDAPSTTSAQTYTFSIGRGSGGTTSVKTIGSAAHPAVLSLMEIGA